jgi:hypothetical protein
MRRLAAFGLFIAILLAAPEGRAQTSAEGAAQLKAELQEMVGLYNKMAGQGQGEEVYILDEISVVPEGGAYNVLLRNLRLAFAREGEAAGVAFGDLSMRMAPLGDQLYRVSDLGPLAPIALYDETGQVAQISIAEPKLEGDFSTRYLSYLTLDASAASLEVTPIKEPGLLRSGPVTVTADSQEVAAGVYDQQVSSEIGALTFSEGGAETFRLDRLTVSSQAAGVNMEESAALMRRLAEDPEFQDLPDLEAIAKLIPGIGDTRMTLEGLKAEDEGSQIAIGQMIFAGGYDSGDGDLGKGDFEISVLDIAASGPEVTGSGLDPRLIPTRFTFKGRLDQLPNKELLAFFTEAAARADAQAMGEMNGMGDEQGMMAAMLLADSLASYGATFTIDELSFANQIVGIAGTGSVRGNAQAVFMAEGFFRMQMAGMQNLQKLAQGLAASQNQEQRETGQGLLGLLGLMMIYAQGPEAPQPTVEGALAYDLKIKPDGAITINGTPLLPPQPQQQ